MEQNNSPKVSILALSFNQSKYCLHTLESINQQTYGNIELIIVDDCSSDNSVEIIDEWINIHPNLKIQFIKHQVNRGICKSLSEALQLSSGDYISLIACDDIMLPEKIEKEVILFSQENEDVALIYSDVFIIDDHGIRKPYTYQKLRKTNISKSGKLFYDLLKINFIVIGGTLIKTSCLKKVGGFDDSLSFEDYDVLLRLSRMYSFSYHGELLFEYRKHDKNTSLNISFNHGESYLKLLYKHYSYSEQARRIIKSRMKEVLLSNMLFSFNEGKDFYNNYPEVYSDDLILKLLILNKSIFNLFMLPMYKLRNKIIWIRNNLFNKY